MSWWRESAANDVAGAQDGESWADEQARLAYDEWQADKAAGVYDEPFRGPVDPGPLDELGDDR